MNNDNKRLAYIEGGKFERIEYGDERNAVVAEIKMPSGFKLSPRHLIILEVDEWDLIKQENERLLAENAMLKARMESAKNPF